MDLEPEALDAAARAVAHTSCDYPVCIGGECSHECERHDRSVEHWKSELESAIRAYLSRRRAALPAETREVVADLERQAAEQHEIAHDCDCAPEVTQNWKNAIGLRTAARLLTEQAALLAQPPVERRMTWRADKPVPASELPAAPPGWRIESITFGTPDDDQQSETKD